MNDKHDYSVTTPHTHSLAQGELREYWVEYLNDHILRGNHTYIGERPCRVQAVRQETSQYTLHACRHEGIREFKRTMRHTQRYPDEDYRLFIVGGGDPMLLRKDDEEMILGPGKASLFTQYQPFDMRVGDFSGLVLKMPYQQIADRTGIKEPLEVTFDINTGLARLVADMMKGLYDQRHHLTHREFNAGCDRLVELMCLGVVGEATPTAGYAGEIESALRQYVCKHSASPDLSLATVAGALGWSPRRLQEVMRQAGTSYRELVREARLECARNLLSNGYRHRVTIADVAYRCGFSSASLLSTVFRQRYGETPREYRLRMCV